MLRLTASCRPITLRLPTGAPESNEVRTMAHLSQLALLTHMAHLTQIPSHRDMAPLTHAHTNHMAPLTQTPKSVG